MTRTGCLILLALLCCNAACPSVSLAVAGTMTFVVTMALPGHPDPNEQSPVT